jgi:hypothetical protein
MLTGHLPFDAENAIGIAMQHVHSQPPSPWDYNPDLPTRAVATVMRALEKEPERRYRDAAEFAQALGSEAAATGATGATTIQPIVSAPRQHTTVYEAVERAPAPEPRTVIRERRTPRPPIEEGTANRWRTAWIALGVLLLAAAVAAASFFASGQLFGAGSSPTPTPTSTPKPTPKPRHRKPTPSPTIVVQVVPPNPTSTPPPPLPTATPPPPKPTNTPRPPKPTNTPRPPKPTNTPPPPENTPTPPGPTPTATPVG